MKVISANLGRLTKFQWKGREKQTGIYKHPAEHPIYLMENGVDEDVVVEPKIHGGPTKACYLYSVNHYSFWQKIYPKLDWGLGMFGENLTVEDLDETKLYIGDVYEVGEAEIVITEPRQPCYKLGHKMGDQGMIQKFIDSTFCGSYVGVLEDGHVDNGDEFVLLEENPNKLSIADVFKMIYATDLDDKLKKKLQNETALPEKLKKELIKKHKL